MIDLSTYDIQSGDLLLWGGNDRTGDLQLPGDVLDGGIQEYSDSVLSHASMLIDPLIPGLDGKSQYIVESTIRDDSMPDPVLGKKNGVQVNLLSLRVQEYGQNGGRLYWCALSERWRNFLDWNAIWLLAMAKIGRDQFSITGIIRYVMKRMPLVSSIPPLDVLMSSSTPGEEVCSELVAMLLQAGGIPGLHPAVMPPQALAELRIYEKCVQVMGEDMPIARFNTV